MKRAQAVARCVISCALVITPRSIDQPAASHGKAYTGYTGLRATRIAFYLTPSWLQSECLLEDNRRTFWRVLRHALARRCRYHGSGQECPREVAGGKEREVGLRPGRCSADLAGVRRSRSSGQGSQRERRLADSAKHR